MYTGQPIAIMIAAAELIMPTRCNNSHRILQVAQIVYACVISLIKTILIYNKGENLLSEVSRESDNQG